MFEARFLLLKILFIVDCVDMALITDKDGFDEFEFLFKELIILFKRLYFIFYLLDEALKMEYVLITVISLFFIER